MENIENLNLKKFSGFGAKISRKISITGSYSFGFPPAFYTDNGLADYSYAILFYDENAKVIGIHFIKEREEGAFKMIPHGKDDKTSASFVARSFFNTFKLPVDKIKGRYEPNVINQDSIGKIFLIQVKEAQSIEIKNETLS